MVGFSGSIWYEINKNQMNSQTMHNIVITNEKKSITSELLLHNVMNANILERLLLLVPEYKISNL